ncbi:MAG TPA: GIY-YIG nuclease family protein [Acidobacteriota bacterium]|nr:GIY-YIG nuclease family protein [Acidobacteriota bacterium]
MWYLYMLECNDGSLYTGVTNNPANRLKRHNAGKGAKYTRSRRPVRLVYFEKCGTALEARRREGELKGWRREKKQALIGGFPSEPLSDVLRISGQ